MFVLALALLATPALAEPVRVGVAAGQAFCERHGIQSGTGGTFTCTLCEPQLHRCTFVACDKTGCDVNVLPAIAPPPVVAPKGQPPKAAP
jgi:hypothetical protein